MIRLLAEKPGRIRKELRIARTVVLKLRPASQGSHTQPYAQRLLRLARN